MVYEPTLTPYIPDETVPLAGAGPTVLVQFFALAAGTQTVNVYRVSEGRQFRVRGGVNLYAVGGATVMDYEPPGGTTITYQAEQFNSAGVSLGFTGTTSTGLFFTRTYIHQPLNPLLAVTANIMLGSADDFSRPSPGSTVWPEGATVGRTIGGQRRGLTGMPLRVRLPTTAALDTFGQMFGSYTTNYPSVICIRNPGPVRIPRLLFAGCLDPHETIAGVNALLTFTMAVDEVAPPYPGLIIPTLRRADIDAAFPTRGARAAAYATRGDRDADFSKAGLAG
ncbi:hypothetical protein KPL76_06160 [Subtercola sp. PAMC28395]|uniref:hypothetical protein n=1 Tax=Subtercola sp. PAMC28395 TaxID=2846775 RepID=UPI001C0CB483|nr:hypothetical protein [Subtercola sp. PAMC28395]QWT24937.1 hypothetical protein KPL76_06160 [Subtercola sp. PAMC28395]